MKKLCVVFLVMGFSIAALAAESVVFVPQLGVHYKNISFDQTFRDTSNPNDTLTNGSGGISEAVYGLTGSVTAVYGQFYGSFKIDQSLASGEDQADVPYANAPTELQRYDFVFTAGYSVMESLSVFFGYLYGETTIEPNNAAGPGSGTKSNEGSNTSGYEQTYEEDGLFVGATYGLPLADIGQLALSIAYADLDSTYNDNANAGAFNFEGDADGISLSATFSASLTDTLGYYVDLRHQQYDAKYDAKRTITTFLTTKVDTEETITALSAGLRYFF